MFKHLKKFKILLGFLIIILFIIFILSRGYIHSSEELRYGVTFSQKQAKNLGFDWKKVYIDSLDELHVKKIRLAAYWDEVEKEKDKYDWSDLDWQIKEASKREVEIILAVGGRLPRWPECHFPAWATELDKEEREKKILDYIEKTITRYRDQTSVKAWQVENEPFLPHFGECPKLDSEFLDKEIELVRSLDKKNIVVTDSGELSAWVPAAKRSDIFGTTMYRDTYSEYLQMYVHYPIKPSFFQFKKNIARLFADPKKWIVIELQAEPWGPKPFQELSQEERDKTMNLQKFKEIIEFSRLAGFSEFYLWGLEWWYWEKEKNNNPAYWEEAKYLFN